MAAWEQLVNKLRNPGPSVKVALVGKYVQLNDAYLSVVEALQHACIAQDASLDLHWVCAEQIEADGADALLRGMDAVVVPGGFGNRGVDGKIAAIRWAREQRVPFFGLCLGMQTAVIEWARNQAGLTEATSAELNENTPHPVIHLLPEQQDVVDLGGTMRLGVYPCRIAPGTLAQRLYGDEVVYERHRHRYEFNNSYRNLVPGIRICGERHVPGWTPGGVDRTERASVLHRLPVPPRIPLPAWTTPSVVPGIDRSGPTTPSGFTGSGPASTGGHCDPMNRVDG